MRHTNKPNQSPETLYTTESYEVVSQDQALVDLNKLLMALSDYQKKLVEQGQDTSEIDAKIYQLQQDKAVLESGNITNKQAITQRINEEMKNFNSLVYSANTEVEKNPSALQNELKAYFDKPEKYNQSVNINGTIYTIAEIIWKGWISDGKNGAATIALRDIMYQETGRSIETAKQTMNVSENPKDFLKNFQQEAVVAFQKEITDSNGTIQINKFKQAFEFVSELGDLQNVEAEAWKFSWLDKNEKQALLEHMPAVQGIVGSIMTKSIFNNGYRFAFNSDNTVIVKPKNANYNQDKQIEQALNDAIARKPGMVPVLKAGLLYQDQDLLKYLQLRADSAGKNISAEAQTPEAFMEYLKNPGRGVSSSDAARAIMDSQHFFDGMNFDAHLKSVSYVPSMASALAVAMNNPDVQRALGQSGQTVVSNPQNTYSSWLSATYYNTIWNTVPRKKSFTELEKDFKERPIGTLFSEIGNIAGAGLREFTSSPSTMVGGLILLIAGRWLFGSWKASLGVFAGTLGIAGAWSRYGDIENASKIDTNATLRTMVPDEKIQESVQKTQQDAVRQQNPDMTSEQQAEQVEKRMNYINELRGEKYYPLKDYVENKNTQNPTDKIKAILWDANPEKDLARSAVTTQINAIHTNVEGKLSLASPNADVKKEFQEHLTLDDAMRIAEMSDENAKQLAIAILNTAKQQAEQAGDHEAAQLFQKMTDEIKNDNSGKWIKMSYFWVIMGGTAIGVGAGLLLGIGSFAKKLWYGSTRAMLEAISGKSSKNASIDNKSQDADSDTSKNQAPDDKPQDANSDTSKNQTPDDKPQDANSDTSSDEPKPNDSTEKITEADNDAKIRANMANAVKNSTLTINGSTIHLNEDALAKYNDLQNKMKALSNNPNNPKLQSEMQKSFNNFYYSVDPDGKIITKNVRTQIVEDIKNAKFPQTMEELIQRLSKSAKSVL